MERKEILEGRKLGAKGKYEIQEGHKLKKKKKKKKKVLKKKGNVEGELSEEGRWLYLHNTFSLQSSSGQSKFLFSVKKKKKKKKKKCC